MHNTYLCQYLCTRGFNLVLGHRNSNNKLLSIVCGFFGTPCTVSIKKNNIHEYLLCFTVEKTFGPWDLKRIVIIYYRHNYLNKIGWVNQL